MSNELCGAQSPLGQTACINGAGCVGPHSWDPAMYAHYEVGYFRAGHGGSLTVEENRAHDEQCDGYGRCTWQRPGQAALREGGR